MSIIYEPKGRAQEYCKLAANLYKGCEHGCLYCYAPDATFTDRAIFSHVKERKDVVKLVKHELAKSNGNYKQSPILLCFTCDPYPSIETELRNTRQVILLFNEVNQPFKVLTKSGQRSIRDFDLYKPGDWYGTTLTLTDTSKWEPRAAPFSDRIAALSLAHSQGIKTWVSLEPVIDPQETLKIIDITESYVDEYKVGTLNHHSLAKTINWPKFAKEVKEKLELLGKSYYMKNDLKRYLNA